ncbi:MAG: [FeFe] hydrogenase H-cluster maturation GTPase HydF [Bacteroidota bacterium]
MNSKGKESKPHIGIYGRRNNGKSSLINNITGQEIAIVSDYAGTTTDPVKKSIEIHGIGPVVLIDTAGIDDIGELGEKRIQKTFQTIAQIDLALLILAENKFDSFEQSLIDQFNNFNIPFVVIYNKIDVSSLSTEFLKQLSDNGINNIISFSNINPVNIQELIDVIKSNIPESAYKADTLVGDLISYGDTVLLITPIDIEAPEGRLILPQVQVIRDVLDNDGVVVVVKEREVDEYIAKMNPKPVLVVTDSQIFLKADASIPKDIPLTGFSVVLARYKGDFDNYLKGTPKIADLKDGDRVLILESCTHHVSCDDIGRVKIPRWLSKYTGKKLEYDMVSGLNKLPRDIKEYAIVIQCGGCVLTKKQVVSRLKPAIDAGIPVTNYGMAIAYVQGIYERAIQPFTKQENKSYDYL